MCTLGEIKEWGANMLAKRTKLLHHRPSASSKSVKAAREARALEWTKALGMPLAALLVPLLLGPPLASWFNAREAQANRDRAYADSVAKREQSDIVLRTELLGPTLKAMLVDGPGNDPSRSVLQLEMLSANLGQSLDVSPVFKEMQRRLSVDDKTPAAELELLRSRLKSAASNLVSRQERALSLRGFVANGDFAAEEIGAPLSAHSQFPRSFDRDFLPEAIGVRSPEGRGGRLHFHVEPIQIDLDRQEVTVWIVVSDSKGVIRQTVLHVGSFQFPMLDNFPIEQGLRGAILLTNIDDPGAKAPNRLSNSSFRLELLVFPAGIEGMNDDVTLGPNIGTSSGAAR